MLVTFSSKADIQDCHTPLCIEALEHTHTHTHIEDTSNFGNHDIDFGHCIVSSPEQLAMFQKSFISIPHSTYTSFETPSSLTQCCYCRYCWCVAWSAFLPLFLLLLQILLAANWRCQYGKGVAYRQKSNGAKPTTVLWHSFVWISRKCCRKLNNSKQLHHLKHILCSHTAQNNEHTHIIFMNIIVSLLFVNQMQLYTKLLLRNVIFYLDFETAIKSIFLLEYHTSRFCYGFTSFVCVHPAALLFIIHS